MPVEGRLTQLPDQTECVHRHHWLYANGTMTCAATQRTIGPTPASLRYPRDNFYSLQGSA